MKDKIGVHRIIEQKNGVTVKILQEPSDWYTEKNKKRAEKERARHAEKDIEQQREKLIKDKIRELAIAELEKEGKI